MTRGVHFAMKVKPWSQDLLIAAGAYPGFCSMKRLKVFLLPLDGMLVHRRSLPRNFLGFPQQFAGTHVYTWVERGTVRVKCLAQEHNTMSPARARTRTTRCGIERTFCHEEAENFTHLFRFCSKIKLFWKHLIPKDRDFLSDDYLLNNFVALGLKPDTSESKAIINFVLLFARFCIWLCRSKGNIPTIENCKPFLKQYSLSFYTFLPTRHSFSFSPLQ